MLYRAYWFKIVQYIMSLFKHRKCRVIAENNFHSIKEACTRIMPSGLVTSAWQKYNKGLCLDM